MPLDPAKPPPTRSLIRAVLSMRTGRIGLAMLAAVTLPCLIALAWTLLPSPEPGTNARPEGPAMSAAYERQHRAATRLPPAWWPYSAKQRQRWIDAGVEAAIAREADAKGVAAEHAAGTIARPSADASAGDRPMFLLGTDRLGRDYASRLALGGSISLVVGVAAAAVSVIVGTLYGAISGYFGGRVDSVMMRIVDVLYGLPYVLLVVLLAVAVDALVDEHATRSGARWQWVQSRLTTVAAERGFTGDAAGIELLKLRHPDAVRAVEREADAREELRPRELSSGARGRIGLVTLLVAIGGVSWLTLARVVRGQVLSLKTMGYVEAARAMGAGGMRIFCVHLLPSLTGPIVVYAALTVPQAILQESFLSFLGIGVKAPLPSLGNLASEGLPELNTVSSDWWLLLFPCIMLAATLIGLNMVGEALRQALDPKEQARA